MLYKPVLSPGGRRHPGSAGKIWPGCTLSFATDLLRSAGFKSDALKTYQLLIQNFHPYDYIMAPSGSYVYHVRQLYNILEETEVVVHVRS